MHSLNEWRRERSASIRKFTSGLTKSLMELIARSNVDLGPPTLERDWPLLSEQSMLFVLIPKTDFDKFNQNILVKALLHKEGEPNKGYMKTRPYEFTAQEFLQNGVLQSEYHGEFYWAVHNMTGSVVEKKRMLEASNLQNGAVNALHRRTEKPQEAPRQRRQTSREGRTRCAPRGARLSRGHAPRRFEHRPVGHRRGSDGARSRQE